MKRKCIFRVWSESGLWRVVEERHEHVMGMFTYSIVQERRLITRVDGWDNRSAIELCIQIALSCKVRVDWEKSL